MTDKETRKPPFGLQMSFGEALQRFVGTDRKEALDIEAMETGINRKGPNLLTWTKKLSQTDAQQETSGGLVPYLRLTKSSLTTEDFQTWFRNEFFAGAAWVPSHFGKEAVESAKVAFEVTVNGLNLGAQVFEITHGEDRKNKHSTPNTWLHWNPQLESLLQHNNFTDWPVTLTRETSGVYRLDIQAATGTD